MKCAVCHRPVPEGKKKCIYCGAVSAPDQGIIGGVSGKMEGEGEESWAHSQFGNGQGYPKDAKHAEEFLFQQLQSLKSKKRARLRKELLVVIFLISMILAGLVVWFLK